MREEVMKRHEKEKSHTFNSPAMATWTPKFAEPASSFAAVSARWTSSPASRADALPFADGRSSALAVGVAEFVIICNGDNCMWAMWSPDEAEPTSSMVTTPALVLIVLEAADKFRLLLSAPTAAKVWRFAAGGDGDGDEVVVPGCWLPLRRVECGELWALLPVVVRPRDGVRLGRFINLHGKEDAISCGFQVLKTIKWILRLTLTVFSPQLATE